VKSLTNKFLPKPRSANSAAAVASSLAREPRERATPETSAVGLSLAMEVSAYLDRQGHGDGLFATAVADIQIVRSAEDQLPLPDITRPCLCLILNGVSEFSSGGFRRQCWALDCLVVSQNEAIANRIMRASPHSPYIAFNIELDLTILREVAWQIDVELTLEVDQNEIASLVNIDGALC
jgi:hypothetical protein